MRLAGVCLLLVVLGVALNARGGTWNLPLPAEMAYRPLASQPGWKLPGAFQTLEISKSGLRNPAHCDVFADHGLGSWAGSAPRRGLMRLKVTLRCRRDRAVWVGVGRDDIDRNGELDWMECRLLIGLDRGRWGMRQNGMGETVWTPAILPDEGTVCTMEVAVNAARRTIRSVHVTDSAARRSPDTFANFDPGWGGLTAAEATGWQMFRVETRGDGTELIGLSLAVSEPSLLVIQ
jgi:hypothetical protein